MARLNHQRPVLQLARARRKTYYEVTYKAQSYSKSERRKVRAILRALEPSEVIARLLNR